MLSDMQGIAVGHHFHLPSLKDCTSQPLFTPVELMSARSKQSLLVRQPPCCDAGVDAHRHRMSILSAESQAGPKRLWGKEIEYQRGWESRHWIGAFRRQ